MITRRVSHGRGDRVADDELGCGGREQFGRASVSSLVGSSEASHAEGGRITGKRWWIGAIGSFGVVLMIVTVRSGSPSRSGPRHSSHAPACGIGSPSRRSRY